ncbi:MAG TPA: hypothetical protein VHW23_31195 [Kofleriaceae bacterium]|nr:hypothetical protein [Kofleriaceae bacterium]
MPSNTTPPRSSRLKPSSTSVRRNRPACDVPWASAVRIAPASGLGVPASSRGAWRRNAIRSRVAANPTPITVGFLAVYSSS